MIGELAVRETAEVATWTPSFAVSVDEAVAQVEAKHDFFRRVMRLGDHYAPPVGVKAREGEPPPKPVLLKPGAELLLANMGLQKELADADIPTVDYGEDGREGLIRYRRVCRIYRQTGPAPTDRMLVAQAEGSCSSRETKYRYRNDQRVCPECGKPAIIKGKAEYGGGFICFKKKDGCGAKFTDNDSAITGQVVGKIANPDLADVENTILKMADKRALVAATLLATGCSDIFTQDIEQDPKTRDDANDAIDAQFTAHPDDKVAPAIERTYALELIRLMTVIDPDNADARMEKGASWYSGGRTTNVYALTPSEAQKMEAQLKREIEKLPKAGPCEACGATPGAAGTIEEHLWNNQGAPCPNDTSAAAEKARDFFSRQTEGHLQ